MTIEALPAWARAQLLDARVGRLGLADDQGRPRVLPVTFAITGDRAWSAIDRKPKRTSEPARLRWLRARPAAALTVDLYSEDWQALSWVQLLGEVAVLDAADASAGLEALAAKYEQYRADPPPGPVLRLAVDRALCWNAGRAAG